MSQIAATGLHVAVTGAAGFVGGRLVQRLLSCPELADARISINDRIMEGPAHPRLRVVAGDLGDSEVRRRLIDGRIDILFHIAGILGGAAEADPALARAVNIDATLSLLEAVQDVAAPPRVVFASSIAVFGAPFPSSIDDDTRPNPTMVYGAHKQMVEVALEQASARGWIDGVALRLPGIVAKPGADARMKAAFLNAVFFAYAAGRDFTLPVSPQGSTWLLSAQACVEALIHGGLLPRDRLDRRRAFTLPAQCVAFHALADALARRFPDSPSRIAYAPDPDLEAQFGRQPPLRTPLADALGFRHDGDLDTLVARAL